MKSFLLHKGHIDTLDLFCQTHNDAKKAKNDCHHASTNAYMQQILTYILLT